MHTKGRDRPKTVGTPMRGSTSSPRRPSPNLPWRISRDKICSPKISLTSVRTTGLRPPCPASSSLVSFDALPHFLPPRHTPGCRSIVLNSNQVHRGYGRISPSQGLLHWTTATISPTKMVTECAPVLSSRSSGQSKTSNPNRRPRKRINLTGLPPISSRIATG